MRFMKKKVLLLLALAAGTGISSAQSFSDDFESYTAGAYLAQSNTTWKTWNNKPGTTEDVKISEVKAHSGTKSVYFSSVAGGPTDILLPFGAVYNSGHFTIDMWMFVESGKIGYFNLQANSKPGEVWAVDVNLKEDGTYDLLNTTDGVLLRGNYTQNAWHHLTLDINLSTNTWTFLIDETSQGTFSNSAMQVASMDIYAMANSGFYVDDVNYSYTPQTAMTLDGAVVSISNLGGLATQQAKPSITIRNLGSTAINSYDISFTYNGGNQTKHVTGINVAKFGTHTVTLDGDITLVAGPHNAMATISNVNGSADEDNSDDTKTLSIDPTVPAADKMVVGEEATGTWCGWCPRGAVFMDRMDEKYPGLFIPIAVHNGDPMTDKWYDDAIGTKISGYPSMLVDRMAKIDPQAVESDLLKRIVVAPKGTMVTGATYDATTNMLKVSISTTFKENVTGKYTLACVITEDDVKGTTSKYAQANYYSGGGQGKMGGYESKPNPVPASQMIYNHVARAIIPHFSGAPVFPNNISAGTKYVNTFTFDLSGYNKDNIHIVGMLIGPDALTDNGMSATINEAVSNGFEAGAEVAGVTKLQGPDEAIAVYPNPAKDVVYINSDVKDASVSIIDMSGKEVYSGMLSNTGNHAISLSTLSSGLYMVRVITADKVYSAKVVVQK